MSTGAERGGGGGKSLQAFEPGEHLVGVLVGAGARDGAFDDGEAVAGEVVAEVAVVLVGLGAEEAVGAGRLGLEGLRRHGLGEPDVT